MSGSVETTPTKTVPSATTKAVRVRPDLRTQGIVQVSLGILAFALWAVSSADGILGFAVGLGVSAISATSLVLIFRFVGSGSTHKSLEKEPPLSDWSRSPEPLGDSFRRRRIAYHLVIDTVLMIVAVTFVGAIGAGILLGSGIGCFRFASTLARWEEERSSDLYSEVAWWRWRSPTMHAVPRAT
jgi:hypothetical protein